MSASGDDGASQEAEGGRRWKHLRSALTDAAATAAAVSEEIHDAGRRRS